MAMFFILILILTFNFVNIANATDATAANGTSSAIQTAVDTVGSTGGTVTIPAGNFTFTGQVTLSETITIIGAGTGVTILNGSGGFYANLENKTAKIRISGISFISPGTPIDFYNARDFRIDHCYFESTYEYAYMVHIRNREGSAPQTYGVIDHCTFYDPLGPDDKGMYAIYSGPKMWAAGESTVAKIGTYDAIYVEDCYFEQCYHPVGAFNGSQYVVRHSTLTNCFSVDGHGQGFKENFNIQDKGTRCIEVYDNYFLATTLQSDGDTRWTPIRMRCGGGVIYHNIFEGWRYATLFVKEGTSNWVHDYFLWENEVKTSSLLIAAGETPVLAESENPTEIAKDRDFWFRAPSQALGEFDYTPFLYPHYLVTGDTPTYSLTTAVSPSGAGTVALSPAGGSYTAGTTVTITATANTSYTFTSWTGAASGATNPVTVTMNAAKSVTATFSGGPTTYTLTTAVSPTGSGTVTLSPTGGSYTAGTTVTVTATSASGYSFTGWIGGATGTASPVTVTMDADKTVTATFTEIPIGSYALMTVVSPVGTGMIALNPTGGVYTAGTTIQLTATASTGYKFTSWTGSITGNSNQVAVTMDANKAVTATFTVVPLGSFTLTTFVSPVGGGVVALDPTGGVYTAGTTVTAIAIANSGYKFTNWLGDATGPDNPLIVTLNADVTVIAYFSQTGSEETLEVKAYPNPFVASEAIKIIIKGSGTANSKIRIYTLTGKLVRLLEEKQGMNELNWDGKNDAGSVVTSGVYVYTVSNGTQKYTGRIAVIR